MSPIERIARRTLYVPVAAVRPYLVLKATLLMLALDVWLTRIAHGGRYGAGGFNVAHFAWLDAIQPDVSPALYVGVTTLTGLLCFTLALAPRAPRWLVAVALVLHSWGWAMSMLDSYQHHYLLSLVLLALVFFPRLGAEEALLPPGTRAIPEAPEALAPSKPKSKQKGKQKKGKRIQASGAHAPKLLDPVATTAAWAYVALAASIAIVYAYTAYSKGADEWLTGAALQRVLGLPEGGVVPPGAVDRIGAFRSLAGAFGIRGDDFFWLMGHSVVVVQIVCAAGYLLAPFRDVTRSKALRVFSWIALATALSFHLGAEHMELKIGWFSWYMVLYAFVFMLPGRMIAVIARVAIPVLDRPFGGEVLAMRIGAGIVLGLVGAARGSWAIGGLGLLLVAVTPVRMVLRAMSGSGARVPAHVALGTALAGALGLVLAAVEIDLPGAEAAGIAGACALGAGAIALLVKQGDARALHPYGAGAALAALVFFVSITLSDVRYDFYRNVGGDHRRRGELLVAYRAYVKANLYAPEGQGRRNQENELRRTLEERGELPSSRD